MMTVATMPLVKKTKDMAVFRFVLAVAISLCYAYVLSILPHELFTDRKNYMQYYAQNYDVILKNINSLTSWFFAEPLFLYLNKFLRFWLSPEETVTAIVFFNCFSVSFFCFRKFSNFFTSFLLLFFLFFSERTLSMQLGSIRHGVGFAIILLFYDYLKKDVYQILLVGGMGLLHNSFYIIFVFLSLEFALRWIKSIKIRYFILFLIGLLIASVIYVVSLALGIRQFEQNAGYAESIKTAALGGRAFFLWTGLFFFLLFFKNRLQEDSRVANYYLMALVGLIILSTFYFFFPMGRMAGVFTIFVYVCLLRKTSNIDVFVVFIFFVINVYLFVTLSAEKSFFAVEPIFFLDYLFLQW